LIFGLDLEIHSVSLMFLTDGKLAKEVSPNPNRLRMIKKEKIYLIRLVNVREA
jgi:hypothetical protein